MKEWILKHPILTFLLVDGAMTGIFNTIRAFAPATTVTTEEEKASEEEDKNDNESALQRQIESKEEK